MRAAGDMIGAEKLAQLLDIAPRTIYALMAGKRTVSPGILADTRQLLIEHRQQCATVIAAIRAVEDGRIEDPQDLATGGGQ